MKEGGAQLAGGKLCALTDAFDYAYLPRYDFSEIFMVWIPMVLLADSMTLFNLLMRTDTVSTENWFIIDPTALRQAYERRDIADIGCLKSGQNVADVFTEPSTFPSLQSVLTSALLHREAAQ